jgi:hypothetical protein
MALTCRRKQGKDAWHFCSNYRHWPTKDYEPRKQKPTTGEFATSASPNVPTIFASNTWPA